MTNAFAPTLRRLFSKSTKTRAGRIVRKERSTSAPFEGQWTAATQRHRESRRTADNNAEEADNHAELGGSGLLETDGFSRTYQQSATFRHRQNRRATENRNGLPSSGSVTASLSATNQHRRQRAAGTFPRVSQSLNPSQLSIALDPQDVAEHQTMRFDDKKEERRESNEEEQKPSSSKKFVFFVGASFAAAVAVGASGVVGVEDVAVATKDLAALTNSILAELGLQPSDPK